jgi:ankyrin repeat protein
LLKYGAKIDFQIINGYTPLHEAIGRNLFSVALFLYRAGANPLIKDRWGYSPIDSIKKFGDNGYRSDADEKAYKQLLEEFRKAGLLDKS